MTQTMNDGRTGTLTRIYLERFTAFERLELDLNPGINVFQGSNGTGKTHLLKLAYTACELTRVSPETMTETYVHDKLRRVFLPSGDSVGRLIRYLTEDPVAIMEVCQEDRKLRIPISATAKQFQSVDDVGWSGDFIPSVFIPATEMLSHGPGFRSLYAYREIHFEEVYNDILDRAYLPPLRQPLDGARQLVLKELENVIGGRIVVENEEFFLKNENSEVEFNLLAEGLRKLGLLWLLVGNGTLPDGSVLCWDEPEANLNPKLVSVVAKVLLLLQRQGVQVLLATHDYAVLKELELLKDENDDVCFHALYRNANGELMCESAARPFELAHSPIAEAFTSLYDREIERSLGRR